MIHAALIMAHKNVDQLTRLIQSISSEKIHVFVHLDSKMKITDLEQKSIVNCADNVFIINERINGRLDTWTLVEAALSLIKYAKKNGLEKDIHYGYFMLLSGQDYPIKNKKYISDYLDNSYPKPLIDCTPYDKSNWVYHKFNIVAFVKLHKFIDSLVKYKILRKILKIPSFSTMKLLSLIKKVKNRYSMNYGYSLYGGSAWWILPDKVIDFILNEVKNNSKRVNKLKHTHTPEETFFQIMSMASPLSNLVDVNPIEMVAQNCMTYAHFSDVDKPFKGHPYEFTENDFEKIMGLPRLFARKFDVSIDSKILDMIDTYLNDSKVGVVIHRDVETMKRKEERVK